MRHATSYGIVDRRLLFDRHLHRMSLEEMALYLFLVLAANREGQSYYGDRTIGEILRLSLPKLAAARTELVTAGLVAYSAPNWWVKSLPESEKPSPQCEYRKISASCTVIRPSHEPAPIRRVVPEALKTLLQTLEEKS